jgi:hypothetical protein
MDVPEMTLKGPDTKSVLGGHAARTLSPGASMSGLRTPGAMLLGPREENHATAGAGRTPSSVLLYVTDATLFLGDDLQ